MIGRLILSLKKAADPSAGWSVASNTYASKHSCDIQFAPISDEGTGLPTEEGIPLGIIPSHVP